MQKILIDTDVVLNVLLCEEPFFVTSLEVFVRLEQGETCGFVMFLPFSHINAKLLPMQLVEQTLLQVSLHAGHWTAQVTAATGAVSRGDLDEMIDWFTGSERELTIRCDPFNLFLHPLPSGHYALGIIHSVQNNTQLLHVRILFIPPKTLLAYGNHPIALFESLQEQIPFVEHPPNELSPLILPPPRLCVNSALLEKMQSRLGAMAIAQLMQSLFNAECTLFTSRTVSALSVLSALFDLLPIPYRPELTFSSDFFLSAHNSFRLTGFNKLHHRTIRLMKQWGVPVISLERSNKGSVETLDPWARFVYQLLETRNFAFLEHCHQQSAVHSPTEMQIMWDNLNEVGVSMSKAMLSAGASLEKHISATEISTHTLETLRVVAAIDQMLPMLSGIQQKTIKAHREQRLGEQFPQFREELSELEAYLMRAMFGDDLALTSLKQRWMKLSPQLASELSPEARLVIQEEIVATIHAVLTSADEESEQQVLRSAQLLELMVFFLR